MFDIARIRSVYILFACLLLTACASTASLVSTPRVDLTSVELESASFDKQTFLLAFDVANPNAFPLPVKAIKYRVMLDDERFAGGESIPFYSYTFQGFVNHAPATLHIDNLQGRNAHHIAETVFKAFGRSVRTAVCRDERMSGIIPSTKGSL